MKVFSSRPWYAEGLAFECIRCGRCCAGPEEGYVWITEQEIRKLAEFLCTTVQEVHRQMVRRVGDRYSLREQSAGKDCVFLRHDSEGKASCMIYPVRPTQCRTWPFWPANLLSPATWFLAGARCPGINRAQLHDLDEIERERAQTCP